MNVRKQSEKIIQWDDNSSHFKNIDVDAKLEIADAIDKVQEIRILHYINLLWFIRDPMPSLNLNLTSIKRVSQFQLLKFLNLKKTMTQ